MTLLRQVSERLDNKGKPFTDYYLGWRKEGKIFVIRVRPQFYRENYYLGLVAIDVPSGEALEKYID